MTRLQLFDNIKRKKSFLCVGLDPDVKKMPQSLNGDLLAFNRAIIDATAPYAIAFKPNLAFYEVLGAQGYLAFEQTVQYIREHLPESEDRDFILRFVESSKVGIMKNAVGNED
jgi:orotidine-5'-phosphate decarboxylase